MSEPIERWLHNEHEFGGRVQFPFLDEFIAHNVDIHYEAMGDTSFWMSVRCRETGREWHLNLGAINSRARGYAIVEDVTWPPRNTEPPTSEAAAVAGMEASDG